MCELKNDKDESLVEKIFHGINKKTDEENVLVTNVCELT